VKIKLTNCPNPDADKHLVYLSQSAFVFYKFIIRMAKRMNEFHNEYQNSMDEDTDMEFEQSIISLNGVIMDFESQVIYPIIKHTGISNVKKHGFDSFRIDLTPEIDPDIIGMDFLDFIQDINIFIEAFDELTSLNTEWEIQKTFPPETFPKSNMRLTSYCKWLTKQSAQARFKFEGYE
jgi:hypothetical protein